MRLGKFTEAVALFTDLISRNGSGVADAHNNLGLCYGCMKEYEKAVEQLKKAVKLNPKNVDFLTNLGTAYRLWGKNHHAMCNFVDAAELEQPNSKIAYFNMGSMFGELHEIEEAEKCFRKALKIDPEYPAAHVDLAYACHLGGNWEEGFRHYEYRFKQFPRMNMWVNHFGPGKLWDGDAPLAGKHLVVWCEQGTGDAVMFSRYLPHIKGAEKVTVTATPDTESFFKTHQANLGITEVSKTKPEQYDYHCSILSLPHLLGFGSISPAMLKVEPHDWGSGFKVGVCWAGSPAHPHDRQRSVHVGRFEPLTKIPGVRVISLQRDHDPRAYHDAPEPVSLSEGREKSGIENVVFSSWPDLAGMMSWIKGLDLVITVDTAILHLAGTLGVPTWGLLPYNPDWRWEVPSPDYSLTNPDGSCWYHNSFWLYRQPQKGDWDSVFRQIESDLRGWASRR